MKISKKLILITAAISIAVFLLIIFYTQGVHNKAIYYEEQISTAQSDIQIQEKRRADLIPNLVDCVKDYNQHEYNTLMATINARDASDVKTAKEVKNMLIAVAEAYPELKSNANYKELMNELAATENLITTYRNNFNNCLKKYNQYVRQFPHKQILSILGYELIDSTYLDYNASESAPTNIFDK